ncbi:unnamed protein product [Amoebophrya sp. A25]|nr:unnamed protein product [Amoebophrya sp. A25]|eukprot:GSA25T00027936001.1
MLSLFGWRDPKLALKSKIVLSFDPRTRSFIAGLCPLDLRSWSSYRGIPLLKFYQVLKSSCNFQRPDQRKRSQLFHNFTTSGALLHLYPDLVRSQTCGGFYVRLDRFGT